MNRPHFPIPYSESCFRRNMEESVGLESLLLEIGSDWNTTHKANHFKSECIVVGLYKLMIPPIPKASLDNQLGKYSTYVYRNSARGVIIA